MKRKTFIKTILGTGLLSFIPISIFSKNKLKNEYTFDELFTRLKLNEQLVYPKTDTDVYKKIIETIGEDRIIENGFKYFLGRHDLLLPVKDVYTMEDFNSFIFFLENAKQLKFSSGKNDMVFRLVDNLNGFMHYDLFIA